VIKQGKKPCLQKKQKQKKNIKLQKNIILGTVFLSKEKAKAGTKAFHS